MKYNHERLRHIFILFYVHNDNEKRMYIVTFNANHNWNINDKFGDIYVDFNIKWPIYIIIYNTLIYSNCNITIKPYQNPKIQSKIYNK